MTSWEQSPTQMSRAVQPCTPPRRKRVHSENGQATHSKESPNGSSPQSTPHSVKRRMLSRTQSLGTPDRSGSPFVSTIPKFYSLDATQSPGAGSSSTRASPTGDDNVQSNGIPSGSPCNSSMVRLQRPSTPVSVGDAIRRATYRDQLHLAQHTAPELIADAAIDSEQSVEGVSLSDLRSLGANRRFIDEVGYLLEPMTAMDARIEVKRAIGSEVIRKMNDDEWLGKLVACGDLPKVWQALNRARSGESDSALDNIVLLFCARALSSKLVFETLPDCTGIDGLSNFVLDMLCRPSFFLCLTRNRKEAKRLGQLRELYVATVKAADDDLRLLARLDPCTAALATYCASSLVAHDFLRQAIEEASADSAMRACVARIASERVFVTSPLLYMGLLALLSLREFGDDAKNAPLLFGDIQGGKASADVIIRLSQAYEATVVDLPLIAKRMILVARFVGWGMHQSTDWGGKIGTSECREALWKHAAELASAFLNASSQSEVSDCLTLVLSLLFKVHVGEADGRSLDSDQMKLLGRILARQTQTNPHSAAENTCHIICRGFAALLVGIRATAPCSETKAEDLIATLEEFRQLNGAVAQAAIDHGLAVTTGSNQPSTAAYTLFVDAEQLDVALKRVRAVMD